MHAPARAWMETALGGTEAVGFPWVVLLAFIRIATLSAVFPQPLAPARAVEHVEEWLAGAPALVVEPGVRHLTVLRGLLTETGTAGNLVSDAHLAALALEHDATMVSFDRDFGRFPGLTLLVPSS